MRRTSLTPDQAQSLAHLLRKCRLGCKLSIRQLGAASGIDSATIVRLERGDILTPQPDTLKSLATALDIPVSDLFTVAEWLPAGELPSFGPYMRAKYRHWPDETVAELENFFDRLANRTNGATPTTDED